MAEETPDTVVHPGKAAFKWVSLAARIILGGVILYAGLIKIPHLAGSVEAVKAYQLPIPMWSVTVIGYLMPIAEIVLGAVIIAGLFTRWTALLGGIMMLVYIALIASAWARGLSIDCGCLTPGGLLAPGQTTKYLQDILRDIGLLICAGWLVFWPHSPFSVDGWIAGSETEIDPED
ncbi:MAG: DoxX family protein [Propionibacteriaceae bacterium]|nr:DoxX family protein [Propionibacteriaceae bacterium]